jgi:hypothetical protein
VVLGGHVAALDPPREHLLLRRGEQGRTSDPPQIQRQSVVVPIAHVLARSTSFIKDP